MSLNLMYFHIFAVGENKNGYLSKSESEFLKRLQHYCRIRIHTVKSEKITNSRSPGKIRTVEGERLLKRIPQNSLIVALDRKGKNLSSEELAKRVADWQNRGIKHVALLIGGTLGLSEHVLDRADFILSLSRMTFTHEMVRLIFLEQLYRCFTILRGEKYHK
jgi:23S rRNA (pseudouridine1915-N3)-methyltransferase